MPLPGCVGSSKVQPVPGTVVGTQTVPGTAWPLPSVQGAALLSPIIIGNSDKAARIIVRRIDGSCMSCMGRFLLDTYCYHNTLRILLNSFQPIPLIVILGLEPLGSILKSMRAHGALDGWP